MTWIHRFTAIRSKWSSLFALAMETCKICQPICKVIIKYDFQVKWTSADKSRAHFQVRNKKKKRESERKRGKEKETLSRTRFFPRYLESSWRCPRSWQYIFRWRILTCFDRVLPFIRGFFLLDFYVHGQFLLFFKFINREIMVTHIKKAQI